MAHSNQLGPPPSTLLLVLTVFQHAFSSATYKDDCACDCHSQCSSQDGHFASSDTCTTIRAQTPSQHTLLNHAQRLGITTLTSCEKCGKYLDLSNRGSQTTMPYSMARLFGLCPRRMRACYTTIKALSIPSISFVAVFCDVLNLLRLTTINPIP